MTTAPEPKQERSRATRARLLEAAVHCLATQGWNAATVAVIAKEAGISRGALQHHFPTREDLIVAALDYTFEQRSVAAQRIALREENRPAMVHDVLTQVVDLYTGDLFRAALQVWTVAAADPALRAQIVPLEQKFARRVHGIAVDLLGADDSDPDTRGLIQATLDLARGLGLADVLTDDSRRRAHVLQAWSTHLANALTAKGGTAA